LQGVNPSDPSERHSLKLPAGIDVLLGGNNFGGGTDRPLPAGWSADGTTLALSSEHSGDMFVMKADGSLTRVIFGRHGCCNFVVPPWLSPDGKTALFRVRREGIDYADLAATFSDRRMLDPPLPAGRSGWMSTWLADGRRVAFVSEGQGGDKPTVHVADFSSGANRRLTGLDVGHIRHIISSPKGSELLVVAGAPLPRNVSLNPLVSPQPTSLYILDADGSGVRTIASGYYVAAAWSPDGTQIAAIEYDGSRKLVVMDTDGTGKRVLVELPADELFTGLAWHPLPDN
jgi:Tol biopolymer transport system component